MRVLYLSPAGGLGGAERCLLTVLAAIRRARPEAELHLLAVADGPLLQHAADLGVSTHLLPLPAALAGLGDSGGRGRLGRLFALAPRALAAVPALRRYVRKLRGQVTGLAPDLVHSNGLKTHLLLRLAAPRVPLVWHLHDFLGARPLAARFLPWAAGGIDAALAVSQAVRQDARRLLKRVPITVVYNAIDVDRFTPRPGEGAWLDCAAGLPPASGEVLRVGLIATYARWKGQPIFLEAAAQVMRTCPQLPVRFFLIGGPIYQTAGSQFSVEELKAVAARLGLGSHVGFLGFQEDPVPVYRALDIVVHASTAPEPFGLTIVEAMACGKPVVVARAGGAAELFDEHREAVGVTPGRPEELAAALVGLAVDAELRQRLGAQARSAAETRFAQPRLGDEILTVYDQLASGACQRPVLRQPGR